MFRILLLGLLPVVAAGEVFVGLGVQTAARAQDTATVDTVAPARNDLPIDFEGQIRPLLLQRCSACHGPEDQQSSLRLDARHGAFKGGDGGPVIVAGNSEQSELFRRINSDDSDLRMPPDEEPLPSGEIELLKRWIDQGADWPETDYDREAAFDRRALHWAFQPLSKVVPPEGPISPVQEPEKQATPEALSLTEIDRFLRVRLAENGLTPSPRADRRTLIRRLHFDLVGLPPTPEEVAAFEHDESPDAWTQRIDRLLASPRYGERWAQYWLDIVRYADTHGFEVNTPRENAWRYRDYVIQAFNEDKPFDQFIREQLAGDVLQADAATGFLVASAVLLPGQIGADDESKRLARQDALDEIIVGTSGTLLGLTVGCARCHDHKFDPITAADYYAMQAFFAGVDYGDRPIVDASTRRRQQEAKELEPVIAQLEASLQQFQPLAFTGRTLLIDDQDTERTSVLQPPNGTGTNPEGTQRGYRDDPGSADHEGNLSGGQYTWWTNVPGQDVFSWNPQVSGQFDLWISWGAHGSGVHTRDAQYLLDADGDLATRGDQQPLLQADQYYPAGITAGETEQQPLWSGLQYAGSLQLSSASKIVLRGGQTGTGITADVILLQESSSAGPSATPSDDALADSADESAPSQTPGRAPRLRAPVSFAHNVERFAPVRARFVRFTTLATHNDNQYEPCLDELEIYSRRTDEQPESTNLALASAGATVTSSGNLTESGRHQLAHIHDGRYGNDFSWISNQRGGGWVQIELPAVAWIDRVEWGRDRTEKYRDRLPVQYSLDVSEDGQTWRTVATHADRVSLETPFDPVQAMLRQSGQNAVTPDGADAPGINLPSLIRQRDELVRKRTALLQPELTYGGVFRDPDPTYVLRRGDPEQRLDTVAPAIPAVFMTSLNTNSPSAPADFAGDLQTEVGTADAVEKNEASAADPAEQALTDDQQRRLALANWIASPDNPLTARVMVNRIWQYHFGQGLVDTPSDFGLNGARPSHPELLDWLAAEFIRSGWSIRHMHRLMLQTAAYQQSHVIREAAAASDGDNRLLWRFASRRLEAEVIRDSMLQITGELNLQSGGPGFNFFKTRGGLNGFPPVEQFTSDQMRRMIYAHKVRMEQVPVFGAFDCPDAGQAMPTRSQSTTAIQALNLFNSDFVWQRALALARRLEQHSAEPRQQLHHAFLLTLGRTPSPAEEQATLKVAAEHGMPSVCRVLLNCNEFLVLP